MIAISNPPHGSATDAPDNDPLAVVAALQSAIADLQARVAQLEQPPSRWLPLKAAAHDAGLHYETVRTWAVRGLIEARLDGGRWVVNFTSLMARKARLQG